MSSLLMLTVRQASPMRMACRMIPQLAQAILTLARIFSIAQIKVAARKAHS
uniref:Uncharacterized protein n=1 Tax=Arundo donax TaxID=35708 RepID=A0A0A9H075_ARUDO